MFQSKFLRAMPSQEFVDSITEPGHHVIPTDIMAPRQVRITDTKGGFKIPSTQKLHRGSWVTTVTREDANMLVTNGYAEWEPQSLMVMAIGAYLNDEDVIADAEETDAANNCDESLVAVAIIGESRSTLAVCRNIVSGCQKVSTLVSDAEGAIAAANIFLVED